MVLAKSKFDVGSYISLSIKLADFKTNKQMGKKKTKKNAVRLLRAIRKTSVIMVMYFHNSHCVHHQKFYGNTSADSSRRETVTSARILYNIAGVKQSPVHVYATT